MGDKKELVKKIVYKFAELSNVNDKSLIENYIEKLCLLEVDDIIDSIIISLNDLLNRKVLTVEQILSNADMIIALNPQKYHSADDLINRLEWIKSMNLEHPSMPLTENHKLVTKVFDEFNKLIGMNFDCFYTGGLMGYLATNHPLERYHGDLDLFINEEQLMTLYDLVKNNDEFKFVSNMDHKETNGHEYKITYKDTPMSIGLFLFNRLSNGEVVLREYYYPNQDTTQDLCVDERHFTERYASMMFSDQVREHNGTFYRMQTLESIYNSKKNSRPKDKYDASIIESFVDKQMDSEMDSESKNNYDIKGQNATGSIVYQMEEMIKQDMSKQVGL